MGPDLALAIDACMTESSPIVISIVKKVNEVRKFKGKCVKLGREATILLQLLEINKSAIKSIQTIQDFKTCLNGINAFAAASKTFTWIDCIKEVFWKNTYHTLRKQITALKEVFIFQSVTEILVREDINVKAINQKQEQLLEGQRSQHAILLDLQKAARAQEAAALIASLINAAGKGDETKVKQLLTSEEFSRLVPSYIANGYSHRHHIHELLPTIFLQRAAEIGPDALAIHHTAADSQPIRLTYREFADYSRGFAYYLRKHGYRHVGILCPNTPAFLISIFGIAAAGAINTAANYQLDIDEIDHIFDYSNVDAIVVDREIVELLDGYKKNHPEVKLIVDEDKGKEGQFYNAVKEGWLHDEQTGGNGWGQLETRVVHDDSLIAVAYTSGTTAKPKGVEYTHRGVYLAAIGNAIESGLNYHQGRVGYLWTLPMFHAMGWTFPWAVTLVCGIHYCLRKINYAEIWELLKKENITHFNASPTVNKLLCNHSLADKLPGPVHVTVAGSSPTPRLFEMMTRFNLQPVHVYGLTETYGPITKGYPMPTWGDIPESEKYQRMVRQGHGFVTSLPIRVIRTDLPEGRIVNVKQDGKEMGEVIFEGNICAKGYYNNPEGTRTLYAGGVLHSGDIAVWHEDGSVQIQGRPEDIIFSGGEVFSSISLESMLEEHPAILEAGVVAVADKEWGERPKAYITAKSGAHVDGNEVIEWMKHNGISKFRVPREVEIVEELPKTSTGKFKKGVLRGWAKCGEKTRMQ